MLSYAIRRTLVAVPTLFVIITAVALACLWVVARVLWPPVAP